jgi:hypothetical protein
MTWANVDAETRASAIKQRQQATWASGDPTPPIRGRAAIAQVPLRDALNGGAPSVWLGYRLTRPARGDCLPPARTRGRIAGP